MGARTEVLFTDAAGRRWQVFVHSIMAGRRLVRTPGAGNADYQTFVTLHAGKPRQYHFFRDGATGGRGLEPSVLETQLREADEIQPRERQRAG